MKTKLFTLLTCIWCVSVYGQHIGFDDHIITTDAEYICSVFTVDIDGDGDMDVLSATPLDKTVAWYENDGQGTNWNKHIISTDKDGAFSVYAADLDGDDDMDVISASYYDNTITWFENDGLGNFVEHILTTNGTGAINVFAADINGDGYMDVLAAYKEGDIVAWFENDGLGNFVEHNITTTIDNPWSIYAADLDGDDDIDVLSASNFDQKLVWHENMDGLGGNFDSHIIASESYTGTWRVCAADLDGDNDIDVLANLGDDLDWYENDGDGNFTIVHELQGFQPEWLDTVDIDNDGDMDILSAETDLNNLIYYENTDGLGSFERNIIRDDATDVKTVCAADINDDGLMDLVSGWWSVDTIYWHENMGLGVDENTLSDFTVYPNPTTGILTIQSDFAIVQIEIYNQLGQLILSNSDKNTIDVSELSQGLYFCKIKDENGNTSTQKIIKK